MKISIAEEFSDFPIGRHRADSDFSGEAFREDYLAPKLKDASSVDPLVVVLDGASGYLSSFLEEAFGGLVREKHFTAEQLHDLMKIEAGPGYQTFAAIIWEHIDGANAISEGR